MRLSIVPLSNLLALAVVGYDITIPQSLPLRA